MHDPGDICPGCKRPLALTARPPRNAEGYWHPACYRKRGPAEAAIAAEARRGGPSPFGLVGFIELPLPTGTSFADRLARWQRRQGDKRPDPERGTSLLDAIDRIRQERAERGTERPGLRLVA